MNRTLFRFWAASFLLLGETPGPAKADLIVDATISRFGSGNSTFGALDLTTGRFTASADLSYGVSAMTSGSNGTLYRASYDGNVYAIGDDGAATAFGTAPPGLFYMGLTAAPSGGLLGLYEGANFSPDYFLDRLSPSGQIVSTVQLTRGAELGYNGYNQGAATLGTDGTFYFNGNPNVSSQPGEISPGPDQLYRVEPTTGITSAIGTGTQNPNMGLGYLSLVTAGGTIYGIDDSVLSGFDRIGIYIIDPVTGLAADTGVSVTGLPDGFVLDTAAARFSAVPEPSSVILVGIGLVGVLGGWESRRLIPRTGHRRSPPIVGPTNDPTEPK